MPRLKGMTWSHPRGYDPLVAASAEYMAAHPGVEIAWDKRSLQDFEDYPVGTLAAEYDLIIIDHPHVGAVTAESCLLPLDRPDRAADLAALAAESVGKSFPSYDYAGHLWALPVDAATQVQAWRPDLLDRAPTAWAEVMELARAGRVLLPLRPPHGLCCVFTLAANLGTPCCRGGRVLSHEEGVPVLEALDALARLVPPECFGMDPIAVSERLVESDREALAPLIYGYVSYAWPGFRRRLLRFADLAALGDGGPRGGTLGGTGLAVSARTAEPDLAVDFAFWVAGAPVQRGVYAAAGGQPGNAAAWEDDAVNRAASDFYRDTRRTLEASWLRPRHAGYIAFQNEGARIVDDFLQGRRGTGATIDALNQAYADSRPDPEDSGDRR